MTESRFEMIVKDRIDDLLSVLNSMAQERYFTIIHIAPEVVDNGKEEYQIWRAIIDWAVPAVMPIMPQQNAESAMVQTV